MTKYIFDPTDDPYLARKFNGFIGRSGEFYMVSKRKTHEPTHIQWATEYVNNYTNYVKLLANLNSSLIYTLSRIKDKQELLINYYGFVYYGHDQYTHLPITIYPDYDINNKEITIEQKRMLYDIMLLNDELKYYKFDHQKYEDDERHNEYINKFIVKQIEKGYKNDNN